jgi:hypothetical protein
VPHRGAGAARSRRANHRRSEGGIRAALLRPHRVAAGRALRGTLGRSRRAAAAGRAEGRPRSDRVGNAAARDRQAQRDPQLAVAAGPVRRRLGEVGGGVARPRGPLLPIGSVHGAAAGAADTTLGVVLRALGGDRRRLGGPADRAGAQDQRAGRSACRTGVDRRTSPGARQGGDPVPARRGRGRAPRRHRPRSLVSRGE